MGRRGRQSAEDTARLYLHKTLAESGSAVEGDNPLRILQVMNDNHLLAWLRSRRGRQSAEDTASSARCVRCATGTPGRRGRQSAEDTASSGFQVAAYLGWLGRRGRQSAEDTASSMAALASVHGCSAVEGD